MAPTRERRLTATERLWLAADDVARDAGATPFVIETYAVGVGEPEPAALEAASEALVQAWPLAGARLEGAWWRSHHRRLPVRVVDAPRPAP